MNSSQRNFQPIIWLGVFLLLVVTSWLGWRALRAAKPEGGGDGPGRGRPPSTVLVQPATEREVAETIAATGTLRAVRRAEVAARESAAVDSLLVDEGAYVEADSILAKLDGRRLTTMHLEAEADLTAARAALSQREAEHQRARESEEMIGALWQEQAVAEREYLDSVRELKVAAARENAARKAIEAAEKRRELLEVRKADLEVRAPFAGRIVTLHTESGEWLREGDPVVTMVSAGAIEAWLQLPERQAAVLRQTLPHSVTLEVPGHAEPIEATELSLIPEVEGRSRRFTLVARIPDPDSQFTPGTSVAAAVPLGAPVKRVIVPSDAVLRSYAGSYVMAPDHKGAGPPLARRIPVTVLFERNGEAILGPGELQAGDQVVVEGNERLFPNSPIAPHPLEAVEGSKRPAHAPQ
jgi:multidrug efflux system membrane fusion protein